MAKRRESSIFSLSFLDIMSCGFGAVILIFILIDHASEVESQRVSAELRAEVKRLEEQVEEGNEDRVEVRNTLEETNDEIITAETMATQVIEEIQEVRDQIQSLEQDGSSSDAEIAALKQELKALETEADRLEGSVGGEQSTGSSLRSFVGEGNRQYLTGINVGGEHVLILLDTSASMLHRTIVDRKSVV